MLSTRLSAAVDQDDAKGVSEFKEALEFMGDLAEHAVIRKMASRSLHLILVVRPANRLPVFGPMVAAAAGD